MEDDRVVPAVPEDFEYPNEVEYLDTTIPGVETTTNPIGAPTTVDFDENPLGVIASENFTIMDLVQMFVVYAFIIAAALSAVFIFIGGISFILSGGDDEKIKRAVNTIRYSIIGLIVVILSFTVVTIVGRMFGLNFLDYLSYGQIKTSINQVISGSKEPPSNFDIQR